MNRDRDAVLDVALHLARCGWRVFPCVPDTKRPMTVHGMLDATTDPDQIRTWWRRTPSANLAVPTGRASIDVLDVDVRANGSGYPAFNALARAGLLSGHSRVVATPSGGLHLYFRGTDQPCSRLPDRHLDFKARGGYVLFPPSVVDGHAYQLVRRPAGPYKALDWDAVRRHLAPPTPRPAPQPGRAWPGVESLVAWVARLPEGRRNEGTFWAACRAVEHGIADLEPLIHAAMQAGLPELEARRTVTSATRRTHPEPPPQLAPYRGPTTRACPARGRRP